MARSAILSVRIVGDSTGARRSLTDTERRLDRLGKKSGESGAKLTRMYQQVDAAASLAVKVGGLTTAVQALAVQAVRAGQALAPLGGLAGGIPGAAGAAGAAVATLKVATSGFGEAVATAGRDAEGFAEATRGMAPAMVSAVQATASLRDAFAKTQTAVQAAFWRGLDSQIRALGTSALPTITAGMTSTAAAANGFARELLAVAGTRPVLDAISQSFALAGRWATNLGAAVRPVVTGLALLVAESARMQTGFAGAASAGERFQAWAQRVTSSGQLAAWFTAGKQAASDLGSALSGIGRIIAGVAQAAAAAGGPGGGLGGFAAAVNRIADAIMSPAVQRGLTDSFARASAIASAVTSVLVALLPTIARFGPELLLMGAAWKAASMAMGLYRAAMSMATAAQTVFNLVAAANPIGLVVVAILAVVAAIAVLYAKSEAFRSAVQRVAAAVQAAFSTTWQKITAAGASMLARIKNFFTSIGTAGRLVAATIATLFAAGVQRIVAAFTSLRARAAAALQGVSSSARSIAASIVATFAAAPGRIVAAFSAMVARIRGIFGGLADAARNAASRVSGALSGIAGRVSSARSSISSLWGAGWHQRAAVASTLPPPGEPFYMTAERLVTSPTRWGAPNVSPPQVVNISVTGAIDPSSTARQIRRLLDRDAIRDGSTMAGGALWA